VGVTVAIRMVVTDLDRTLLRSDHSLSDYTVSVLNTCRKHGIKIVFATVAKQICLSNDDDGVVKWLEENLLNLTIRK